ncbi:Transcriptional regulator, AcrR family [hydrothermal vent metagenome]|uniref:Transcriptional regulator, AcrR family n=1 Tax=hydrothermal vent metagenome TaxID=652676 RepID=A0A3B1D5X7_9ZZZZ
MNTSSETKQQIIDVADKRFRRYGFGKTTMAEIAKDCNMSAANLYRYFENKETIGVTICQMCLSEKETLGKEVLKREGLNAAARLETFFFEILQATHNLCANDHHLFELVAFISKEHVGLVKRHQETLRAFLAEILAEGNRGGEFEVADIVSTADTILLAMVHFCYPPLVMMETYSFEQLVQAEKAVVTLLVQGLAKH